MSGAFGNDRRSRTRSPADDYVKKSILAKVSKSELKLLRVAVRRSDVIGGGPQLPLERSIDDPTRICSYVHYRKDESKRPQPPIFGGGIKVNQDFTENRRVFTHAKNDRDGKPARKSRSRSQYRSRSPRNRPRSRSRRATSRERDRKERSRSLRKSRSIDRSKRKRSGSRRASSRRSLSKHRSKSGERRKYKDSSQHYSSRRSRRTRSPSRSPSPHEHEPSCPMYGGRNDKKSLTPLRPGEYRPGHPDLALRSKRQRSRSRSRSDDRSRSRRSRSRDDVPLTSRDRSSPGRHTGSSKTVRRYQSPVRSDKREPRSRSRTPIKSDRYRRRSRSYNNHSPTKRSYKGDKNRSPRRRSRSPQYGEDMHVREYGFYEGWGPGPRMPLGRGGYPMQPFYAPAFHPRGMLPGPLVPPGHMIVPRMPIMPPYGPYRPHLPIYNSGAVRPQPRGTRLNAKPSTITSEKDKDGDSEDSRVVITEVSSRTSEKNEDNGQLENTDNSRGKNGDQGTSTGERNE